MSKTANRRPQRKIAVRPQRNCCHCDRDLSAKEVETPGGAFAKGWRSPPYISVTLTTMGVTMAKRKQKTFVFCPECAEVFSGVVALKTLDTLKDVAEVFHEVSRSFAR